MIIKTYRLRLMLFYTTIVVIIFSSFAYLIFAQYKRALHESVDKNLVTEARAELQHEVDLKRISPHQDVIDRYGDELYEVINQRGEVVITSVVGKNQRWPLNRDLVTQAFAGVPQFDTVEFRGAPYRVLYFPVSRERILRIGASLEEIEEGTSNLKKLSFTLFPLVLFISGGMSWFLAGKALAPVVKIRSLAEEVRHGSLGKRIEMDMKGREIDDLVRIFNEMLDNIQHSIEAQKRFTSDVSHEIRSPLTSLRGSIEVALRKKRSPEEYEELLITNLSDIIRLSKITDNLLFLARADNNIIELRKQRSNIGHLIRDILERVRYKIHARGIGLSEEYHENLELHGDMDLLDQAFTNLIDNAVKYTPPGGTVTVKAVREGKDIVVAIKDTGIGIPQDDIPHIFERFYRAHKHASRQYRGTGLGLAIVQWIINAHNGKILVKSTPETGSEFTIIFPAAKS